jgi:N-acetyl-gamma-glutamylphosphate reductase
MKAELTSEDEAERSDSDLLVTTIIHDLVKGTTGIALLNINVRLCLINV